MQDATYWGGTLRQGQISFAERVAMIEEKSINKIRFFLNAHCNIWIRKQRSSITSSIFKKRFLGTNPSPPKIPRPNQSRVASNVRSQTVLQSTSHPHGSFCLSLEEAGICAVRANAMQPEFGFKNITDPNIGMGSYT